MLTGCCLASAGLNLDLQAGGRNEMVRGSTQLEEAVEQPAMQNIREYRLLILPET